MTAPSKITELTFSPSVRITDAAEDYDQLRLPANHAKHTIFVVLSQRVSAIFCSLSSLVLEPSCPDAV